MVNILCFSIFNLIWFWLPLISCRKAERIETRKSPISFLVQSCAYWKTGLWVKTPPEEGRVYLLLNFHILHFFRGNNCNTWWILVKFYLKGLLLKSDPIFFLGQKTWIILPYFIDAIALKIQSYKVWLILTNHIF